jgi:hypothetical protein
MTTPENEKSIYQNPQIVEVEKKEEKMAEKTEESSPNQTATTERNQETRIQDNKELLSTTTGTATSSPKNRN